MGQSLGGDGLPAFSQGRHGMFEVNGIPEYDGGDYEVQAAGPVPLVLVRPVAQLPQPMEKHGLRQGIAGLPLVEPDMDPPSQLDPAHVLEQEQRRFQPTELTQRNGQAILPRISAEFPEYQ